MVKFHLLLVLPSTKWHLYYKEPTLCSASPAGIVSTSEGHPTFKAVVDEKIFSVQSHVADSNKEWGYCTRGVPLQGTYQKGK